MKRTSQISTERVIVSRRQRFNPLKGLKPESLSNALEEFRAGNLRRSALLWDAMIDRDLRLKSVVEKREKAPARCEWEVITTENSPRAKQHAAALRYFYNNCRVTSAYAPDKVGGLAMLRRQMQRCVGFEFAIHEIVLKPARANGVALPLDETGGSFQPDTLLTAEFRFAPLWWFECRNGPLAYLANDWDYYGTPLQAGEWLVSSGARLMEASSILYLAKMLAFQDALGYSEKFGLPWVDLAINAKPGSDEWAQAVELVENFIGDGGGVRSKDGSELNLVEAKNSATLPFDPIMKAANMDYAIGWRGGDLGTEAAKTGDGTGSNLQESESDVLIEDDCADRTEELNLQVDPLVTRYLFGEEPLAYVKILPPRRVNATQDQTTAGFLADRGVPVGVNQLRERLGWPEPEEGDELLGKAAAQPDPQSTIQNPDSAALANEGTPDVVAVARAAASDLATVHERLARILQISDDALFEKKLREFFAAYPQLEADLLADPAAAHTLAGEMRAALLRGISQRKRK